MTAINKEDFFDLYRIKYKVGEGGYGSVFKIQDKKGDFYALKTIICQTMDQLTRSFQEILMISTTENPAIVKMQGFLTDKKNMQNSSGQFHEVYILGIIMEYAEASLHDDLTRRRATQRFYNRDVVYKLLDTMIDLLAELQTKKIAHRDIKPENILLTRSGMKLTDFGLAKVMKDNERTSNSYAGSPFYVAPKLREAVEKESFGSLEHDVFKSDVFSLGLNILEAASLCDIRGLNSVSSLKKMTEMVEKLTKGYDKWFVRVLKQMLDFNENKRPDFVDLKKIIAFEKKEAQKKPNPFLLDFQAVYQQDVVSYINENEERLKQVSLQEEERMEKVKVNYESFVVKKQSNCSVANKNQNNNETKENEKKGDIFDEVVMKTEDKNKKQRYFLRDNLETTKKMVVQKHTTQEPIILQEYKIQNPIISKTKKAMEDAVTLITTAKITLFEEKSYLLTAGEETFDVFMIANHTKPLQMHKNFKLPNMRVLCLLDFKITAKTLSEKFVILGTACANLLFFRFVAKSGHLEQPIYFPELHSKAVTAIGAISDQNLLITGSSDFSVRVIHLSIDQINGKLLQPNMLKVILGHSNNITCVDGFSGTHYSAISGSVDSSLILWNLEKGGIREKTIQWDCDWVSCMKLDRSTKEERVFCGSGNAGIAVFNARTGHREKEWDYLNDFIEGWVSFIDYNEEWDVLVICEGRGKIILVDSTHRKKIIKFEEWESDISAAFLVKNMKKKDGFLVLVTNFDGRIRYVEISEFSKE